MGWEDRQYYRDRGGETRNPLMFLVFGSIPLYSAFGIRVRAHMSLILFIAITILMASLRGGTIGAQLSTEAMAILFGIVLLHEYGHCVASRSVGGEPDQIVLSPLGGAAFVNAPHRPGATFVAVAGGPLVNVLICLITAAVMALFRSHLPWNPIHVAPKMIEGWLNIYGYIFWINIISLALLLFNLLPIFPLDGGQLLQSLLWFKFGYYKSMMIACITGIIGGVILAGVGLFTNWFLTFIAISGIMTCVMLRQQLKESGPEMEFGGDVMDFSASLRPDTPAKKRRRPNRWAVRRLRKQARRDATEQQTIDDILAKVSAHGMHTLTWSERRALKRATDRQRKRDVELSRND